MKYWTLLATFFAIAFAAPQAAQAQSLNFGDDSSTWSNDGECDDPRFEGNGMASTLLDSDLGADASDCRTLYERGQIRMRASYIDFGDDSSRWAFDDECDDPRFVGSGMAGVLLEEDLRRDATDCRSLYQAERIELASFDTGPDIAQLDSTFNFGNDSSQWANDGECDDPRFEDTDSRGGMAAVLLDEDTARDASDCRALYNAGRIRIR